MIIYPSIGKTVSESDEPVRLQEEEYVAACSFRLPISFARYNLPTPFDHFLKWTTLVHQRTEVKQRKLSSGSMVSLSSASRMTGSKTCQ